jgi:hypothetical protein
MNVVMQSLWCFYFHISAYYDAPNQIKQQYIIVTNKVLAGAESRVNRLVNVKL